MESLLVSDDLDRDKHTGLVINTPDHLPKTSLSEHINDFVSVGEMIASYNRVVAALIIVAKVRAVGLHVADHLGCVLCPAKVDVFVVDNLAPLVDVEDSDSDSILGTDTLFSRGTLPEGIQSPSRQLRLLAPRAEFLHFLLSNQVVLVEICGPDIVMAQSARRTLRLEDLLHNGRVI